MNKWLEIFTSIDNSGIHTFCSSTDISDIHQAADLNSLEYILVDMSGVTTRDEYFDRISRALRFPSYFGKNWDALEECLNDLSWFPDAKGFIIVFNRMSSLARKSPTVLETGREIFVSSADLWKKNKVPFFVLLQEKPVLKCS